MHRNFAIARDEQDRARDAMAFDAGLDSGAQMAYSFRGDANILRPYHTGENYLASAAPQSRSAGAEAGTVRVNAVEGVYNTESISRDGCDLATQGSNTAGH